MAEDQPVQRPHLGWWISIVLGMSLLGVLAFDGPAYALWCRAVTGRLPQALLRWTFAIAVLLHIGEALYALWLARRSGLGASAAGWFLQTLTLGYPSLGRLRALARQRIR
jgi:hypothetical protein